MTARQCKLAIKQTFTQDSEKETAAQLHTGRGTLSVEDGLVRLCCHGDGALPAQTVTFPLQDPLAVTAESGLTKLCFRSAGGPITVDTPMGAIDFDFWPDAVENSIELESGKGALLLRYRLTWGEDAVREAEIRYTLLGFV